MKHETIEYMMSDTPLAVGYWAKSSFDDKQHLLRIDDNTGYSDTTKLLTPEEYARHAIDWASNIDPEWHDHIRRCAALVSTKQWDLVDYDGVILDLIAQHALFGKPVYG